MRLINVKTLKLEWFLDDEAPPYAIVSHTWGDDHEELTLLDVDGTVDKPGIGSTKLRGCCRQAEKDGLAYAWMDTCCIDKRDVVELGEAINSMFRWYREASVCYAYLSDVPADDNPKALDSKFRASRWFQRGWTLQELLAPESLSFYSSDWEPLGTKINLSTIIEGITGIPRLVLRGVVQLQSTSVAQRMSWAANRKTKRKEDMAYSLQGIFSITMSMIYGEGEQKAFFRLQEEIMKDTPDHSILAWGLGDGPLPADYPTTPGRILAATPADFANSGHIVSRALPRASLNFVNTSRGGVQVHLPLVQAATNLAMGLLHCGPESDADTVVAIPLVEAASGSADEYVRPSGFHSVLHPSYEAAAKLIHIKNDFQLEKPPDWGFLYDDDEFGALGLGILEVEPTSCWDKERNVIMAGLPQIAATSNFVVWARLRHHSEDPRDFFMMLKLSAHGPHVKSDMSMAVCRRATPTLEIRSKFRSWATEALGKHCASTASLDLQVTLEPIPARPCMFNIKPIAMKEKPKDIVDITQRLELIKAASKMTKAACDLKKARKEHAVVAKMLEETVVKSKRIEIDLEEVTSEIRRLEAKLENLTAERTSAARKTLQSEKRKAETIKKETEALSERTSARVLWDVLHDREYDEQGWVEKTKKGWTPLMWACHYDDPDTTQLLLDNGAVPTLEDADGHAPLQVTISKGFVGVAKVFLAAGVPLHKRSECSGKTLLHYAVSGSEAMVCFLLDEGAEVNAQSADGSTALHVAVRQGASLSIVQLLLAAGADARIKNRHGLLAWEENKNIPQGVYDLVRKAVRKGPVYTRTARRKSLIGLAKPTKSSHKNAEMDDAPVATSSPRDTQISQTRSETIASSSRESQSNMGETPASPQSNISKVGTLDSYSSPQNQPINQVPLEYAKPVKSRRSLFQRHR
ncbi:hypothetical protein B0T25DRAFT_566160 [Lasiosphaeria hispida]|uniref:Heterokaryon incompatibility domain-containing protein n=1 Tax=Lasiosphaeria hispida TaxID=260671 RepID=A0AAJ0MFL1_9PEZI|nr:hypothetical protein B0T25DRAFT_566160 [Lasiosphaeria hispida]